MVALRAFRFHPCLMDVMAVIAQRLPVGAIPKQHHVTLVRFHMVNQRSNEGTTFPQVHAPGIARQERCALFSPSVIVSPLRCISSCHFNSASCLWLHISHAAWRELLFATKSRTNSLWTVRGGLHRTSNA